VLAGAMVILCGAGMAASRTARTLV